MGGKNNGFFFFFGCGCDSITVLTFLQEKKKTLKGMLFQNLYENILVRQKLKMNQDNPLINSIDYCCELRLVGACSNEQER